MPQPPLRPYELERELKPRPALKDTDLKVSFKHPIHPPKPGVRVFPPPVKGTIVERASADHRPEEKHLMGYLPDHLALNPVHPRMDERLKKRVFFDSLAKLGKDEHMATTIFPPDSRYTFSDTSYPWCTVGRVDLTGGVGSGALVGPRHLLCASHMMTWNPDNSVDQVTFTPSYFDGNAPFGNAGIIEWYAYRKVVGPNLSSDDIKQDYVVLVLDQRLGDLCGYMGIRSYSTDWNGQAFWSHIGYPGDLNGAARPSFQSSIAVDSTDGSADDEDLWHQADIFPGQSGGPFFAWWGSEAFPRIGGVQSGQNAATNSAGGGHEIGYLVSQARADFP